MFNNIERKFFSSRVSFIPSESTTTIKRRYFSTLFPICNNEHETVLIKRWLRKIIIDNAGSITSNHLNSLLSQALSALTFPVSKNIQQNWITLYTKYLV